ncbi:MAG: hypothetical protein R3331_07900 [Sulfurospirillaceae bacterium]|nr:hypothetical protein [Sulfurospirillaceae bacterium]
MKKIDKNSTPALFQIIENSDTETSVLCFSTRNLALDEFQVKGDRQ